MDNSIDKRILFFLPLPPPVHGAALRNKALVESKLLNSSFTIEVLPFDFAERTEDIGRFSFSKAGKMAIRSLQIISRMFTFKPHLVYFNISLFGFAMYRDFFFVILFKLFNPKMLYHLRTQGVYRQTSSSFLKRKMFSFIFRGSSVICLSDFLSQDIRQVYFKKPYIVNNGIEDVSMKYPKVQKETVVRILFVSNLMKSKGVVELISALKILKNREILFKATIVGSEGDLSLAYLNSLLEQYDLQQEIELVGPKYGDEKFNLYRKADIFVMPTYFEAFPGTILEAMQFGLPVVSTVEGAIPEIVDEGKTGLLVEKKDIDDLAKKIELLVKNENLRQTLGGNGRQKFVNNYTLAIFEKKMVSVFKEI